MSVILSERLQKLGSTLPLPARDLLKPLAASDLLRPYLQRLLLEEMILRTGVEEPGAQELEQATRELAGRQDLPSDAELDRWRQAVGLDLAGFHDLATFPLRLERATQQLWGDQLPATFLERRADFDQVILSLVRFEDPELAQELYFQLQEGELTFAAMVETHAEGADRQRRGLVGPLPLRRLHPLLAKVVERYPEGALVPPIDIEGKVHLIRVETFHKAQLDDTVRSELLRTLRAAWLREQLQQLEQRLREPSMAEAAAEDPSSLGDGPTEPAALLEVEPA